MDIATDNLGELNKDSKILSADSVIEALNTHDTTLKNKFSDLSTALVAQITENEEFKTALKTALGIA